MEGKHDAPEGPIHDMQPNDTAFSGERKRVRCNAWLGCVLDG